uniref:Uncharacterized protein n=1 Tax=Utricularia reniformis TaxID=192314 RepID=A0A1Y0B2R8_9LAMI|nr:hypothetical protein AEK19_MT1558 [Utricularia reniformis]ART31745.1 hypothetical protein AEK19_MT1558 [Utricularia reniformis]
MSTLSFRLNRILLSTFIQFFRTIHNQRRTRTKDCLSLKKFFNFRKKTVKKIPRRELIFQIEPGEVFQVLRIKLAGAGGWNQDFP